MTMLAQNRSLVDRLRALVGAWRLRAEPFADHHCDAVAAVYNRLASEVSKRSFVRGTAKPCQSKTQPRRAATLPSTYVAWRGVVNS